MSSVNALSVLLAALPSDVVSSIEAEYTFLTKVNVGATTTSTELRSSASFAEVFSSHSVLPSSSKARSQSTLSTLSTVTKAPSTRSLLPSSTSSHPTLQTPNSSDTSQPHQLKNASIAGITTGVTAAVVFMLLFALFLFRRKREGKAPFKQSGGHEDSEKTYPEIAWLYDAKRTGSQNHRTRPIAEYNQSAAGTACHDRDESGDGLLAPRDGTVEIDSTASDSREYFTPPTTPPSRWNGKARYDALTLIPNSNAEDPLLAPVYISGGQASPSRSPARNPSPGFPQGNPVSHPVVSVNAAVSPDTAPPKNHSRRQRSSLGIPGEARKPLTAIHEESHYRVNRSPETLPNPLRSNPLRHST
ncbi:Hypothetical protein R9X50_00324700 [Acrodontium crateriforme]|uniref:Uncharacterized protein n=1 Tax=Acrodontium crateriforme TaxID=150365 RepID=A0AAQ3R9R5_9PEZI|nr:Hypothetical protein R9X50_00324700 [Acrodontium crateriforme]